MCNGERIAQTQKTHVELKGLQPDSEYSFLIGGIGEIVCKTHKEKRRIDITKPPYSAVGDGKTLNTEKIQRAIDDCGVNECVYVPEGTFLTGSLRLHSDMELYIEKTLLFLEQRITVTTNQK